jgi:hypothetical protein
MTIHALGRFLVKLPTTTPLDATQILSLPAGTVPLFPEERTSTGVDSVRSPQWFLHTPAREVSEEHPWDAAHEVARTFATTLRAESTESFLYVEPDLVHRRYLHVLEEAREQIEGVVAWPALTGLDANYPPAPNAVFAPAWHLDRADFPTAWSYSKGEKVRIAHPDTGYYPDHLSTPKNMFPAQGYNYFENNSDVVDHGHHLNAGHGTATLALLAGKHVDLEYTAPGSIAHVYSGIIGGAPEADIVPVRIGGVLGSVVHLYSSSMAQGLHHALGTPERAPCDVVSLSHGGLPTKAWVDEVNNLYDAGIVLTAASGDNFYAKILDIATHFTVYPSAWWRVVTVTGETFAKGPYTTDHFGVMQGSWGPLKVMYKAVGAYTPNVPWMRLGSPTAWEMNGSGTSAATPQVAAACALWMSKYLTTLPRDWRRVEAVRYMLFAGVADPELNLERIGRGALNAANLFNPALSAKILQDAKRQKPQVLRKLDRDKCSWPFFRILFGLPPPGSGVDEMLELEALQLAYRSSDARLHEAMKAYSDGVGIPARLARRLREDFIREPDMSRTLRVYLKPHV